MPLKFINNTDDVRSLFKSDISPLRGGRNSVAFQIKNFVFRFPKNETILKEQKQEIKILTYLRKKVSDKTRKKIPDITYHTKNEYPFTRHPFIVGKTCNQGGEQSIFYDDLSSKNQLKLATELANFLTDLHKIPCPKSIPSAKNEWIAPIRHDFCFDKAQKHLLKISQIDLANFKTSFSISDIVFIHNDLSGSNLLLSPSSQSVLNGIIDFAAAGLGPRVCDFIPLYKISRKLARETISAYNNLCDKEISLSETDYLVLCYLGYHLEKSPSKYLTGILKTFITDLLQCHAPFAGGGHGF
ncbi:MAG: aminoglycoside phosphotransferase family protein [Pseudomonadota bacterium]|nr:aminoglycoside phosphotransferase family protein [Pseudomonadota bacterium]